MNANFSHFLTALAMTSSNDVSSINIDDWLQVSFVPTTLDARNTVVTGEGLNKLSVNHETGFSLW